jgi:outer membrane protein assembly factor BamB
MVLSALLVVLPPGRVAGAEVDIVPTHWALAWTSTVPFYGTVMASDAGGTVVAGFRGAIVAVDVSGAQHWAAQTDLDEVVNRPALVEDVVVVPSRHGMVALSRATGMELWASTLKRARVVAGTASGRPVVLATTPDGVLRSLDPLTGAELMQRALPAPIPDGAPLLESNDERAIVAWGTEGDCCTIAAFDAADGSLGWKRVVSEQSTVPVVHEEIVVVGVNASKGARGRIVAFDAATGAPRWRTPVESQFDNGLHGDGAEGLVVLASRDGSVIAADTQTGDLLWQSEAVIAADQAHPMITERQVFLTPHSTDLVAFDRATGAVVSGGPIEQTIVVTDTDVVDGHFQLLVTNGFEGQIWNLEPGGLRTDR